MGCRADGSDLRNEAREVQSGGRAGLSEWHPQGVSHVARFKPFERCCMVILFVGGRGKTTLHPTSPPLLLVKSIDHGNHPVAPSLCVKGKFFDFLGKGVIPCVFFFGTFLCTLDRTTLLVLTALAILFSSRRLFPHQYDDDCAAIIHYYHDYCKFIQLLCFSFLVSIPISILISNH